MRLLEKYRWHQNIKITFVTVIIVAVFIRLGIWQLDRYHYKKNLTEIFLNQQTLPAVSLSSALQNQTVKRFIPVFANGHYDNLHQFILDNQTHLGHAGYAILTPLILSDNRAILVNRGFIGETPDRRLSQSIEVKTGPRNLYGRLNEPKAPFILGNNIEPGQSDWPLRIQKIDYLELNKKLPYKLLPYIILLDPKEADGFIREFSPPNLFAEKSLGYAFQWFAFATTLVIIYIILGFKKQ